MSQGASVVVDDKPCRFHYFTGKVTSSTKQKETRVHSSQGGTVNSPTVNVSSTTIDHHEFFLMDGGGKERAFKMVNFDFPCREGQTMTVIWVIPEGAEEGPYVEVHNHNTGERHVIEPKRISYLFKKPWWLVWGMGLGAAIVLSFFSGFLAFIAFFVPPIYFHLRANKAAKTLIACDGLRQLDAELAQVKAVAA
jgi:hypothetical protein